MMLWTIALAAMPDRLRLDRHLEMPASSDPDEAQFVYAIGQRTHAKGGGTVGFAGKPGVWGFGLAGFIELEDVVPGGPFPWQAYRAFVGLRVAYRHDQGQNRWFFDGGYFHESDHAADVSGIATYYGLPTDFFPNATISTQEFVGLRIGLQRPGKHWGTWVRGGTKIYTPNFIRMDQSRRDLAFSAEGRLGYDVVPQFGVWISGYAEVVFNSHDAELPRSFRGGPYRYWQTELGIRTGGFDFYSGVRGGNGRGVSFALVSPPTLTIFGLRAAL